MSEFSATTANWICLAGVLLAGWLILKVIFPPTASKQNTNDSATDHQLAQLKGRFQGILDFLKKTIIQRQGQSTDLATLPWHLIIGPHHAGKTTLLNHAGIHYILAKKYKTDAEGRTPPSETCDWWVTQQHVLVEIPGVWFVTKEKLSKLWFGFLELTNAKKIRPQISSAVMLINLPEWLLTQKFELPTALLKRQIRDLRAIFGTALPFYFVITKCDLLPGFNEFFSEHTAEELTQAFGISLPTLSTNEKLVDAICERFNALIKRLNQQLLTRLHHERNLKTRTLIKDFPLQVEKLKDAILQLLQAVAQPDLPLLGIWLSSAYQPPNSHTPPLPQSQDGLSGLPAQQQSTPLSAIMSAPVLPSRPCFIRQFILQGLPSATTQPNPHPSSFMLSKVLYSPRGIASALSLGIIATALLLFSQDFLQGEATLRTMQNLLAHYTQPTNLAESHSLSLTDALVLLDGLEHTAHDALSTNARTPVLSFYSTQSRQQAISIYQRALQNVLLPSIAESLDTYLRKVDTLPAEKIYQALRARLMLAGELPLQPVQMTAIIRQILPDVNDHLKKHLQVALEKSLPAITAADPTAIADARKKLIELPVAELGRVILKSTDLPPLSTHLSQTVLPIPMRYQGAYFQYMLDKAIPTAATVAIHGNAVLGKLSRTNTQIENEATLTAQLRNHYLSDYANTWEEQLALLRPDKPKDLFAANTQIAELTDNASPLTKKLQVLKENTAFDALMETNATLHALDEFLLDAAENPHSQAAENRAGLIALHHTIETILASSDPTKAAFTLATQRLQHPEDNPFTRMHQLAAQNPEPFKTWLQEITDTSWQFIYKKAKNYAEKTHMTSALAMSRPQMTPLPNSPTNWLVRPLPEQISG